MHTHIKMFEELKFVTDVQNGVSAVHHIESALRENPFRRIGHFKLHLSKALLKQSVLDIQATV